LGQDNAADSDDPMKMLRRLARSAVLAMTLAYALALSGLAGMQMTARHSVEANAAQAFKMICHADGLAEAQTPNDGEGRHAGCPCGPLCGSQQIATPTYNAIGFAWIAERAGSVIYARTDWSRAGAHAPGDFRARGPPHIV
jgi:hypothetical protein